MSDDVVAKLDDIIGLLKLAFAREIDSARLAMLSDAVNRAVLEALEDGWLGSGELQRRVATVAKVTERTVRDRLSDLAAKGAVRSRGSGRALEYSRSNIL